MSLQTVPEAIGDVPITSDEASRLMGNLGFVAFRTPPDVALPDSCLMAMFHDEPTLRHFDPELASYWVNHEGCGRLDLLDGSAPTPLRRAFSWGRIRLVDRLGMRNSFVGFGGTLDGERVGRGALLLIFRSPAPILRLPGHSQRADHMADEAVSFFGRLVPRLWSSPALEHLVAAAAPEELYAAFLVHSEGRLHTSARLREAIADDVLPLREALRLMAHERPQAVDAGRRLLERLGLAA
jgi:hypothetical protein